MPDWIMQLLLAGGGLGIIATAIGTWWKARREDRIAIETRRLAHLAAQDQRIDRLQEKVESLLRDAVAREKEYNAQSRERIAMDAKLNEVLSTTISTLKEATAELSRVKR